MPRFPVFLKIASSVCEGIRFNFFFNTLPTLDWIICKLTYVVVSSSAPVDAFLVVTFWDGM